MLRLIIGRAGTGKTSAVMDEIAHAAARGEGKRLLIVPEQYSHEAERELCRRCGDRLSLYAEVFSFTGLARRVASRVGGGAVKYLDGGGRLLCMALALRDIAPRLRVYFAAARRAELQNMLLSALDELKAACISADMLTEAAARWDDSLGDKLRDLALIIESYDAVAANGHADPSDRLTVLAGQIAEGGIGPDTYIYVDGFIDFTRQEQEVLRAMLRAGAQLTVCLTLDTLYGDNEIFELSRRAARSLLSFAQEQGVRAELQPLDAPSEKNAALSFFADHMFSYRADPFPGDASGSIELWRADSMSAECELAAARVLSLVRGGCRFRDIAVIARGFEDYRAMLESVFRHYGVPLYTARKSDLLSKPLPSMISSAYEIVLNGWEVDDVISYMRSGLAGLDSAECDALAGYLFKWQLRAAAWRKTEPWRQHPDGYGRPFDERSLARLETVNTLRFRLSAPLLAFARRTSEAATAAEHARALAALLDDLKLSVTLADRAASLAAIGREALAAEYTQLWAVVVSALEQCAAILGDSPMDAQEFSRLFTLMLSKYDVGSIPVSLDRVTAGDFDRNRRRQIRHLIVLGAADQRLPYAGESAGVFSGEDRRRLSEASLELGSGEEAELWREFSLIYNCLTLPSDSLLLSCPLSSADGEEQRPAFVFNRAKALFGLPVQIADLASLRMAAPDPALSLAAQALRRPDGRSLAAAEYFRAAEPERFAALERAARMTRGRLSPVAIERLYGKRLRLSASRIEKFASCRFAYFCQYGLRARPNKPALFEPPEIGSFMHFVLEHTARRVKESGGFRAVGDDALRTITDAAVRQYISEELDDFREKSPRFVYLFKRLCADVHRVVADMAQELRLSDFEPLDFELDFSEAQLTRPIALGGDGGSLTLTGVADRVDGWLHDGKLYLRVVDYKTGRKKFSLSDVWYGMNLQMLLYLFALSDGGEQRYGAQIVPAGVMYVPARASLLSAPGSLSAEQAESERLEELRRSGLVLDDPALIEAWEHGEDKRYIPLRVSRGKVNVETVASAERLGLLQRHIQKELTEMAGQLRSGSISADPYYRSQQENACLNCDYYDACHFSDGRDGERSRYMPKLSAEKIWNLMEEGDKTDA